MTSIERRETDGAGVFALTDGADTLGTLDYRRTGPGVVHIDYVEVSTARRGEGLGRLLVDAAAAWARDEHLRLVPICGYARRILTGDPAFRDVL